MAEEKDFFVGRKWAVGVACSQGNRKTMQDAYAAVLSNKMDPETDFFAVFDGHGYGGERISKMIARKLCDAVLHRMMTVRWADDNVLKARVIQNAFLELDDEIRTDPGLMNAKGRVRGGSTACAIWCRNDVIYVAHVGDTRAILSYGGGKIHQMTIDHLPKETSEFHRIREAGGYVERGRIVGALGVSRAFGNFRFKNQPDLDHRSQVVTACPDVCIIDMKHDLQGEAVDFIIIASDGVFEVFNNQDLVKFVLKSMTGKGAVAGLEDTATEIIDRCVGASGKSGKRSGVSRDNVTLMIIVPTTTN